MNIEIKDNVGQNIESIKLVEKMNTIPSESKMLSIDAKIGGLEYQVDTKCNRHDIGIPASYNGTKPIPYRSIDNADLTDTVSAYNNIIEDITDVVTDVNESLDELKNDLQGLKVVGSSKLNAISGTFQFALEPGGVYQFVGSHSGGYVCIAFIGYYSNPLLEVIKQSSYAHLSISGNILTIKLDYGHSWSLIKLN